MSVLKSCGLLALLLAPGAFAQHGARVGGFGTLVRWGDRGENRPTWVHGNALDRWNRMTPEQRQRALSKLPPDHLPEAQREGLRERYEQFLQLPPAKQEVVRKEIREFNQLPDERRQTLSKEFEQLRGMSDSERKTRMESDDFKDKFSSEERHILKDLSGTLSAPTKAPSTPAK
jgi:predicted Fe-S protein YdhL (DUF1289 family)